MDAMDVDAAATAGAAVAAARAAELARMTADHAARDAAAEAERDRLAAALAAREATVEAERNPSASGLFGAPEDCERLRQEYHDQSGAFVHYAASECVRLAQLRLERATILAALFEEPPPEDVDTSSYGSEFWGRSRRLG
ncbi:hypothetical protein M885DRAFT_565089 [Pelagophyceae sp. CCMP2097]|nr:hypothetical protein M885DRAFT_565089 [Pelagophyceae sp. CCMP2097]